MSEENVELVRRITEAVDRGDLDGAVAIAKPSTGVRVRSRPGCPPARPLGVQHGPEGLRRVLEPLFGEFDDLHVELRELIDAGERVFAAATLHGRGKHSGAETTMDIWGVWTFRGGRAVRWEGFTDRDAGLEAAGLSG
jgi:ketosteroid isomerase-like protein